MRRAILITAIIVVAHFAIQAQPAARDDETTRLLQQLITEVKELKLEMNKLQLELQQERIAQWERDMKLLHIRKDQLRGQEGEINNELVTLEKRLGLTLSQEDQAEIETERAELAGKKTENLRAELQQIAEHEAETAGRIERARQRIEELQRVFRKLQGGD